MRFLDFFAGIGGFRLGMGQAGHECAGFCENDRFAVASYTSMYLLTEKQREYLAGLPLKKRQKEILKDEYRNGEWYADDITRLDAGSLPAADCWCYGSPCTSFSLAGKRAGMEGESGLVREIFRLLDELPEKSRPEWLVYENVPGMLSSNRGWDYAAILSEMDRLGYDAEWQDMHSEWFVPHHRERIFTVGHHRRFGTRKIFPVTATAGKDPVPGVNGAGDGENTPGAAPCFVDLSCGTGFRETGCARTLQARYHKGVSNHPGENSGVGIKIIGEVNRSQDGKVHDVSGTAKCHSAGHNNSPKIAVPVALPEGSRGKNKEVSLKDTSPALRSESHGNPPMACLDVREDPGQGDGIYVEMPEGYTVYAVWYEKGQCYMAVRRLTPKETFRLQGFPDELFYRAESVNSDTQLYRQSGNSVTVPVVRAIGERLAEAERGQGHNG